MLVCFFFLFFNVSSYRDFLNMDTTKKKKMERQLDLESGVSQGPKRFHPGGGCQG